jgi:hypothetical protein
VIRRRATDGLLRAPALLNVTDPVAPDPAFAVA